MSLLKNHAIKHIKYINDKMAKKLKVKDLVIYLYSNNPIRINSINIIFF